MPSINQLNSVDNPSASDLLPIYSQSNGDARKISLGNFMNFIKKSFASPQFQTQYSTPGATGFSVQVNDTADNTWLIINPYAGFASGAITLPAVANCVDGQEILVNCTQQVTSFVVNGNGAIQVLGAPTALGAEDFFRMRFQGDTKMWYRVG